MERNEAIDILRVIAPPRTSKKAFYDFMEARDMAISALEGKDTNVPANSALDHIHNVVRDDAYKRGYEQAKEDCIKAVRDCYENILDVETDGHTIADSVEDIITERVRGTV